MSWSPGSIELLAKWLCGNKNKWGWVLQVACGILWIIFALSDIKGNGGLLIVCIPAMFMNIRNFLKWHKEEQLGRRKKK